MSLKKRAEYYQGKPYSGLFAWDPQEKADPKSVYRSELVWLAYKDVLKVELVEPRNFQRFSDFHLDKNVKQQLIGRYEDAHVKIDWEGKVLSPQKLLESDKLFVVVDKTNK